MRHRGAYRRRALLVDGEQGIRRTISRYLQLHGMDVVEVDSPKEAEGHLASNKDEFDLLVAELVSPGHALWDEWKRMVTHNRRVSLLVHGSHIDEWNEISDAIGRKAGFIGKPFTLSDFHWVLHQLL